MRNDKRIAGIGINFGKALLCLLTLFLIVSVSADAAISRPQVILSADQNGDGIAGVGDTITFTCTSDADPVDDVYVTVADAIGFSRLTMQEMGNNLYSVNYTIRPGNINKHVLFAFVDHSSSVNVTTSFLVNSIIPASTYQPAVSGYTGPGRTFRYGDTLTVTHNLTTGYDSSTIMELDLSPINLGVVRMGKSGSSFTTEIRIPSGLKLSDTSLRAVATNANGNSQEWYSQPFAVDTQPPVILNARVQNTTQNGNTGWAIINDTLRITASVERYENDILLVDCPHLFSGGPRHMDYVGSDADIGNFSLEVVLDDVALQGRTLAFNIMARDEATNRGYASTNTIRVDTLPPSFSSLSVIIRKPDGSTGNTAIVGDIIRIEGSMATVMPDITLTVDFTELGGSSAHIIPFTDGSVAPNVSVRTFRTDFMVTRGELENTTPLSFNVTATDVAGNTIQRVAMPAVYVDNKPPVISSATFANITNPGEPVKFGDQISVSATVADIDDGEVYIDLRFLGGAQKALLNKVGSNQFMLNHRVGKSIDPLEPNFIDRPLAFNVIAVDDAGNKHEMQTNSLQVDSEAPDILSVEYVVQPPLSETRRYIKAGDYLTLKVKLAKSESSVYDGQTVIMDLTDLGGEANQALNYMGGYYTFSMVVRQGQIDFGSTFRATATDNDGNTDSGYIHLPLDNKGPLTGPLSVRFLADRTTQGVINIGDEIEITIPVDDGHDEGYATIDLSLVGGASDHVINYMDYNDPKKSYIIRMVCSEAATADPAYVFSAVVYDKAGNKMSSLSQPIKVDCRKPVVDTFEAIHIKRAGNPGVVNVGDDLKFTAEVDDSAEEGLIPTLNLLKVGGSARQEMEDAGDGTFTYTHRVVAGETDGEDVKFKLTFKNSAGNIADTPNIYSRSFFVDNCPINITEISYVLLEDTNGNNIVDLDGSYTDVPVSAPDKVSLSMRLSASGQLTADLSKFGYGTTATPLNIIDDVSGETSELVFEVKQGTVNGEDVKIKLRAVDENGNVSVFETPNTLRLDNRPPEVGVPEIIIETDNGVIGEANAGDVLKIRAVVKNNDGLPPLLIFNKLVQAHPPGVQLPSDIIMAEVPAKPDLYEAEWVVPTGLSAKAPLTVLSTDKSGNTVYRDSLPMRFLSKDITPLGGTVSLFYDANANGIINPGDQVRITYSLEDVYSMPNNSPITNVYVDVSPLTSLMGGPVPDPENPDAYWAKLRYDYNNTGSPYVYEEIFTASETITLDRGADTDSWIFKVRIMHPDGTNKTTKRDTIECTFPIDTKVPNIIPNSLQIRIVEDNDDNPDITTANINDIIEVQAEIKNYPDSDTTVATLFMGTANEVMHRIPLTQITGTEIWQGQTTIATGTRLMGQPLYDGDWRIANGDIARMIVHATDDAGNTKASHATPYKPENAIKIDNKPPVFSKVQIFSGENNDEPWVVNVGNGLATDTLQFGVTLGEIVYADLYNNRGKAWVDLAQIGIDEPYYLKPGTSTGIGNTIVFGTDPNTYFPADFAPFVIKTEIDLATYTFPIWVQDEAGNKDKRIDHSQRIAIDTSSPKLVRAEYDGMMLTLKFSEIVRQDTFNINNIRIGKQYNVTDYYINNGQAIKLSDDSSDPAVCDIIMPLSDSDTYNILICPVNRGKIADWGNTSLYVSIASQDTDPGHNRYDVNGYLGKDEAGNWLQPVMRNEPADVVVTEEYIVRPNLVNAYYNAAGTIEDQSYLYLEFDREMDLTSITPASINRLAIWRDPAFTAENWNIRYRMRSGFDTFDMSDAYNSTNGLKRLRIRLSQEAQDWLALVYGKNSEKLHVQIDGYLFEPQPYPASQPPLARDIYGNRVNPIRPKDALEGRIYPLTTKFAVSAGITLDLTGDKPMLVIPFENRRVKLFQDTYTASSLNIPKNTPVDLSKVYIWSSSGTSSAQYIGLGAKGTSPAMVDWDSLTYGFSNINSFASPVVNIALTEEALNTMLSWGTSEFYIRCETEAFRDLWGNSNEPYPNAGGIAAMINTVKPSSVTQPPSVRTLAVKPVSNEYALFKGQPEGQFFYEVAFDTPSLTQGVTVPIARNLVPTLELFVDDGTFKVVDRPKFLGWTEHDQNGTVRTVAQFSNTSLSTMGSEQRVPVIARISNYTDIFNLANPVNNTLVSKAYNLDKKIEGNIGSYDGFKVASWSMEFDNCPPSPIQAAARINNEPIVNNIVPNIPEGHLKVKIKFNEAMNNSNSTTLRPRLLLVTPSGDRVMQFNWVRWESPDTAEFMNQSPFDGNIIQGKAYFSVSGGYDEAGNPCPEGHVMDDIYFVDIRSQGPVVEKFMVQTLQTTTANSEFDYSIDMPYSPKISSDYNNPYNLPGIATIKIYFQKPPVDNTGTLQICNLAGGSIIKELPAVPSDTGNEWIVKWDGTKADGTEIQSNYPVLYDLKFVDSAGNIANRVGRIVYDNNPPPVTSWEFPELQYRDNVVYYSPDVHSTTKFNVITGQLGEPMRLLLQKEGEERKYVYDMSAYASMGYTLNFSGQVPGSAAYLTGEYKASLVDAAGNLGVPAFSGGQAGFTLMIDRNPPVLTQVKTEKIAKSTGSLVSPYPLGEVDRFNANKNDLMITVVEAVVPGEKPLDEGTGLIKIMSGSTVMRELPLLKSSSNDIYAIWDGKNSDGILVPDGRYVIKVADLAGNEAAMMKEIYVVATLFSFERVEQDGINKIKMFFTHEVHPSGANPSKFAITGGLSFATVVKDETDKTLLTGTLASPMTLEHHGTEVVVKAINLISIDEAELSAVNSASFIPDTKGPEIKNVNFEGLTVPNAFNIVFDERVDPTSVVDKTKYTLTVQNSGGITLPIKSVGLQHENKSVIVMTEQKLDVGSFYVVSITGAKDLKGNVSNPVSQPFEGIDVTPPEFIISAFSNPANEFDIIVTVKANEELKSDPPVKAYIRQIGGKLITASMNTTNYPNMYMIGVHLDPNHSGIVNIKVTGEDLSGNEGSAEYVFTTAYINASMRASVISDDEILTAFFEPGTLRENSKVMLFRDSVSVTLPESGEVRSSIRLSVAEGLKDLSGLPNSVAKSVTPSLQGDELKPVADSYSFSVPEGRLQTAVPFTMKLASSTLESSVNLYRNVADKWELVETEQIDGNQLKFYSETSARFALMRDTMAPRVSIRNSFAQPIKEERPTFIFAVEEFGSGLDRESVRITLDNRSYTPVVSDDATRLLFKPFDGLVGGTHTVGIRASDRAGNQVVFQEVRFQLAPPLRIKQVVQYPNPASSYVKIRVDTNSSLIDDVTVKIYDTSGQLVTDYVKDDGTPDLKAQGVHEYRWDLRNKSGRRVANGVYIAKIEVRDPYDWNKKYKYTQKIAVLR